MTPILSELAAVPALHNRWVAVDRRGLRAGGSDAAPPTVALRSGAIVVDADPALDALCARIDSNQRTSLSIFFVSQNT